MTQKQPRGIRNNNPANIRWGENWEGLKKDGKKQDPSFCVFTEAQYGIRALAKILITYYLRHGINTVRGIIMRYAPPVENDSVSYIEHVAKELGVGVDEKINVLQAEVMATLIRAIIKHENGQQPYPESVIRSGMFLAGIS